MMDLRSSAWARRLGALTLLGLFAVLGIGTSEAEGGDESSDESSAGSSELSDLESHLSRGQAYGDGPGGPMLASALQPLLDSNIGDAVAVRVIAGNPERIVVVLKLPDLRDFDDASRQDWLDRFGEAVRDGYGASDSHIVVGIRGNVFFGAVAVMTPGATTWDMETGAVVSNQPLRDALVMESQPVPAGQIRQDIYGALASDDAPFADEDLGSRPADRVPLELSAGATLRATMYSPEVDTYLYLLGPDGSVLSENDDSDGLNAGLNFPVPEAGTYTLVATGYSEEHGPYALRIRTSGGAAPAAPAAPTAP